MQDGGTIFICGALGGGKTLGAVRLIQAYLNSGRRVASNVDISLPDINANVFDRSNIFIRLPDYPKESDFLAAGLGSDTPKQRDTHGLIVLDECGTWLNSRDAMDKNVKQDRLQTIKFFLDLRKRGWSVAFIVQQEELVDKQIRSTMMQFRIDMKNTQQIPIPIFGFLCRALFGFVWTLPKGHLGLVKYIPNKEQLVDWWMFKGKELYGSYDTEQVFDPTYEHGTYQALPNYYSKGRYLPPEPTLLEKLKMFYRKFHKDFLLVAGLLAGIGVSAANLPKPVQIVVQSPSHRDQEERKAPTKEIDFGDYFIESHFQMGDKVYLTISNGDGENATRYTTDDLKLYGYWVMITSECNLIIWNEGTDIGTQIFCKQPAFTAPDNNDTSHMFNGESF